MWEQLMYAIRIRDTAKAKNLIHQISKEEFSKKELGEIDMCALTALHLAAAHGMKEVCELILNKCPEAINVVTKNGETALHFAAQGGNKEAFEMILNLIPE